MEYIAWFRRSNYFIWYVSLSIQLLFIICLHNHLTLNPELDSGITYTQKRSMYIHIYYIIYYIIYYLNLYNMIKIINYQSSLSLYAGTAWQFLGIHLTILLRAEAAR